MFLCFSYRKVHLILFYFKNNDFDSDFLFDCIRQDCADFLTKGDISLMGDFNAYKPNNAFDYIEGDEIDQHIPLPDDIYHPDIPLKKTLWNFVRLITMVSYC